jgi:hypothetical protein
LAAITSLSVIFLLHQRVRGLATNAIGWRANLAALVRSARRRAHDGQFDLVPRQHLDDLGAVAHLQLEAHVRPLQRERHQHRRQQMLRRGDRADAQRTGGDALQRRQFVGGLFPQAQDALGEFHHHLARRRQLDVAPHLARERHAGDLFQCADLQRHGRLRQVHGVRRARHAAMARDQYQRL